jgi:hypothetical protein
MPRFVPFGRLYCSKRCWFSEVHRATLTSYCSLRCFAFCYQWSCLILANSFDHLQDVSKLRRLREGAFAKVLQFHKKPSIMWLLRRHKHRNLTVALLLSSLYTIVISQTSCCLFPPGIQIASVSDSWIPCGSPKSYHLD